MNVLCAVDGSKHSRWTLDILRCLSLAAGSPVLQFQINSNRAVKNRSVGGS
jgi:phosphatidate phosphatase PAH1